MMGRASASNHAALGVMPFAMFGIDSEGIGLALNLLVIFLVAIWLALAYWTISDARRRLTDPVLIASAVIAAVIFPFAGSLIYAIVRPPETLEDAYERDLDVRAAELRVRLLEQAVKSGPSGGGFAATVVGELAVEPAQRKAAAPGVARPAAGRRAEAAKTEAQARPTEPQKSQRPTEPQKSQRPTEPQKSQRPTEPQQSQRPATGVPSRPSQPQRPSAGSPARRPTPTDADGA